VARIKASAILLLATLPVLRGQYAPYATLYYANPCCPTGDMMTSRVRPAITTSDTYFSPMAWGYGNTIDGSGYCGIQDVAPRPFLPAGGRNYIFSLWDPTSGSTKLSLVYSAPGGSVGRFSGEGTGMNYLNFSMPWQSGQWYRVVVRAWDYNNDTYYAMWILDESQNAWTHHLTMDYPASHLRFMGAASFLEDFHPGGSGDKAAQPLVYCCHLRTVTST
jgi:Domain of unknown function (DUF3472)